MRAVWNGQTIAESVDTIVVEGNHYFPPDSIAQQYLEANDKHTTCPWKGDASYFDVVVEGERNSAAAWCYPETKEAANNIRGYVAFWQGVEVVD